MTYGKILSLEDGTECFVIVSSVITPINNTIEIIKDQIFVISIVFFVLAVAISLYASQRIAKPISLTTKAAKELAKKNYDVEFDSKGYLEVQELNDTLNFAKKELAANERLQRELIANISHDLRTPLTMITGYGEVMRDLPGENTAENIQIIIDEATRLSSLVNDLLDLSKLQSGTMELQKSVFCITDSFKTIFARYAKLKEQDGYNIYLDKCKERVFVKADELKISQVIYNLVNNAINYAGEDKTVVVTQQVIGEKVRINVTDHGEGIPADKLEYIWDRYYKVDKEHKRSVIGTGLGLSIVKSILNAHNARCGVTSTLGKGSTFWFELDTVKVVEIKEDGIRRCGKTVLLGQIKDVLLQRNIPAQNIIQANFESMRFRNTRTAETLYDYIAEKAEGCTGKIYILLDEIQEVERWQIAINSLRVDFDCDIYLTGSNSKLLSGELATYLSGRYIQIQIFPFSLAEAKQQCIENGTYTSDEKLFADYLKYGGFPQRFFLPDDHSITTYLDDLYEAIIVRDIMLRHNIREQTALRNVLAFLLDNIGNPFSARNISGRMVSEGIKTTTATVLNYVDYFKEAFILLNASRYDIKGKALLSSTEKYYAVDLGLRNVIKKSEKLDSNKLYENIVYLEMRSRGYEVQVGKLDDTEIDFICYRGDEKLYIQVAYLITPADEEQEFGNLERLHDNYPKYVISGDLMNLSRNGIIHRNIIDFLLNP